jgi:diguanylate cyclase (GGDEF)-like protein
VNNNLTQRLRSCTTLPTLPAIALKIIDLANDPDADINKACQYIALDPALTAKILKTANSPIYKSRRTATNVRQAVSILGTHAVTVIALSFSLTNSLIKQSGQYHAAFDNNNFWRRSITTALASRALGIKAGLVTLDDLFLAGLLQDIGILAFSAMMPEEYYEVFSSTKNHDELLQMERETFEVGHDELGHALLKKWHLPDYIAMACLTSHNQPPPKEIGPSIPACVAVSRHVADYFIDPGDTGKIAVATEAAKTWLNLDNIALMDVIDNMATELVVVEELFEITIHQPEEIAGIMAEAKELLAIQSLSKVRELEEKSQHDGLTGARNRGYFDETLQREFYLSSQHSLPLTIAMIDLDHFKKINDTYGHIAGDALLIATVRTIIGQIRQDDTLCRYGGEEFSLILPGTTLSAARKLLARLKDSIAAISHQLEDGRIVKVTASIGVAANMDGNTNFECPADLIKASDSALYAAKHAGRNQIIEWNNSLPTFH